MSENVAIDSDYEYEFDAKKKAATTGSLTAASGLTGVTGYFTLTLGGAAISGTSVTLSERSATPGRYYGTCDAAALTTALTTYVGIAGFKAYAVSGDKVEHFPVIFVLSACG